MSAGPCHEAHDDDCPDCLAHDETCGLRCDDCHERMCSFYGPEPRACGTTCGDCPCDCTGCRDARWDAEIDRRDLIARETRAEG